jgi:hypothetical protein
LPPERLSLEKSKTGFGPLETPEIRKGPADVPPIASWIAALYVYVPGATQIVLPADHAEIAAGSVFLGLVSVPASLSLPIGEIHRSLAWGVQSAVA